MDFDALPKVLPSSAIKHRWVKTTRAPNGRKVGVRSMVVDECWEQDGKVRHSLHVAYVSDHPFLAVLERLPHVPKVVKSIYRKEVRLAHLRATDAFVVLRQQMAADAAWAKYVSARRG